MHDDIHSISNNDELSASPLRSFSMARPTASFSDSASTTTLKISFFSNVISYVFLMSPIIAI